MLCLLYVYAVEDCTILQKMSAWNCIMNIIFCSKPLVFLILAHSQVLQIWYILYL
jgi:hypothetical protein